MSVRRLAAEQPASFELTAENVRWAEALVKKYPPDRRASAVIPLLWRAQEQNDGWLSEPALRSVAEFLDMPYIRVYEIATFYTMFNLSPVGKHYVQLCGTTPCMLRGSDDLKAVCRKVIGEQGQVTEDGMFSWLEVECLGACVNAPMVQINKDYYEDLTAESFEQILQDLRAGKTVKPGPQIDRHSSDPEGGPLTLVDPDIYKAKAPAPSRPEPAAPAAPPRPAAPAAPPRPAMPAAPPQQPAPPSAAPPVAAEDKAPEPVKQAPPAPPSVEAPKAQVAPAPAAEPAQAADGEGSKPGGLSEPRGGVADDLKKISGIGPKIEGILHGLGVYHFDQIAAWTPENIAWVDGHLKFKGRIGRENWLEQAKTLAGGTANDSGDA